uniref:Enhance1 n=1 Tax=Rhizobium fredii TaxID=380 RepID=Q9EZ23_RHIFR|nr:enhance1 [Sinorhizobium fredii]
MLSGGQRQRVAIGRAIVREPKIFAIERSLLRLYMVPLRTFPMTCWQCRRDRPDPRTLELYHKLANIFVAGFIGQFEDEFLPVNFHGRSLRLSIGFHNRRMAYCFYYINPPTSSLPASSAIRRRIFFQGTSRVQPGLRRDRLQGASGLNTDTTIHGPIHRLKLGLDPTGCNASAKLSFMLRFTVRSSFRR